MTYNVLNYPGATASIRNPEFIRVIAYVRPDVLIVQEMTSQSGMTDFLTDVLDAAEPGAYDAAPFMDGPDSDNALYYKSSLFTYLGQTVLQTELRDINGYRLRPVGVNADSLDLRIYSAHLKASQGFEQDRFAEADTLRNHLNTLPDGSFLLAGGDFNLYTSTEPAYQELIGSQGDNSGRLYDPINTPGDWNDDITFVNVHTQSTRTENLGDGGALGGLDDRFDFLLLSYTFQSGTRWQYVSGSYNELGNDGNHFNQSVNAGTNTAVPDSIADALHSASDHLPVYLDIYRQVVGNATLALTSPNGSESWYAGYSQTITWTSQNLNGTVTLKLNRNFPGGAWETILSATSNDGSQPWLVTLPGTLNARIQVVSDAQPEISDNSDGNFSIVAPSISLNSPNGGETWYLGESRLITWSAVGVTGNVRIELNRDYPAGNWESLFAATANDGNESWPVAGATSADARIRIYSLDNAIPADTSAADFTITSHPPLIAHDPHGDADVGMVVFTALVTDEVPGVSVTLFYEANSVYDSVAMNPTGNPSEYAAAVALEFGRHGYVIRATDIQSLTSRTDTLTLMAGESCGHELAYDDGTPEAFHWSEQDSFAWAVRFTPDTLPFALCEASVSVAGFHPDTAHAQIIVRVLAANGPGGLPGTELRRLVKGSIGNVIGGLPLGQDYMTRIFLYDEQSEPLVFNGDFYVAVENTVGGTEAFGHDTSSADANRSCVWDPCDQQWYAENELHPNARRGNRIIHVSGWPNVAPQLVIRRTGDDIQLHWNSTNSPYYRVYKSDIADGQFTQLIGSTTDTFYVAAGAVLLDLRSFYRVHSSSSP